MRGRSGRRGPRLQPCAALRAVSLMLAVLGGCAAADDRRPVPVEAEVRIDVLGTPVTEPGTAAVTPPGTPESGRGPAARPTPEAVAAQSSAAPRQVVGLDGTSVRRLFGEPSFVRREPPAEVWQYRGSACVLDLFLYEEAAGPRVAYVEARTGAAEPISTETCIAGLLTKWNLQPS